MRYRGLTSDGGALSSALRSSYMNFGLSANGPKAALQLRRWSGIGASVKKFPNVLSAHFCRLWGTTSRGGGELAIFCGALVGAGLGFLWFNAPPAMVFMGDTGSLAIGGALGAVSVVTKHELVLAIIGGLFVLETASVIVQVASFKMTGKRIFRMAPLHHHFEQKGWAESTIVIRFWIIALILALAGLSTLKIR